MQTILQSIERVVGSLVAGGVLLYLLRYLALKFVGNIEEKIKCLHVVDEEQWKKINAIGKQLDTLQGEHNVNHRQK